MFGRKRAETIEGRIAALALLSTATADLALTPEQKSDLAVLLRDYAARTDPRASAFDRGRREALVSLAAMLDVETDG